MIKLMKKTDKSLSASLFLLASIPNISRTKLRHKQSPSLKGRSMWIWLCFTIFFLLSKNISAQSYDSNSYHIDFGNFNMTSGKKTSTNYTLTDTVGQNAPGKFDSNGYVVKAGFQYIYDTLEKFSFSISDLDLPFGSLIPNIGSTQSNVITITTPSGHGYEILAIANHPFLSNNYTIPDTSCNNNDCTINTSTPWTLPTAYGLGFNALGINSSGVVTNVGTSNYFSDSTYYRPFADFSKNNLPQVFMSENTRVKEHSVRITYKVNISPNQASGNYQNAINLIAIPKY